MGESGENNFVLFDFGIVLSRANTTDVPGSGEADFIVPVILCGLFIGTLLNFTFKVLKGRIDNCPKLFEPVQSLLSLV